MNVPEKTLTQCKLGFALFGADGDKPIRSAGLAQLRAGSLQVLLSTTSLVPGDYRLVLELFAPTPPPTIPSDEDSYVTHSRIVCLPFTLTPRP